MRKRSLGPHRTSHVAPIAVSRSSGFRFRVGMSGSWISCSSPDHRDGDVPRDGHALLARAGGGSDRRAEGGSPMTTAESPLSEIILLDDRHGDNRWAEG